MLALLLVLGVVNFSRADSAIDVNSEVVGFGQKPVPVALEGFTGEALDVLKFDLYVQGFSFVSPDAAQYVIHGSDAGDVSGTVTDRYARRVILSRSYNGASVRRQAHAFADDIVSAITGKPGIAQLRGATAKVVYKTQPTGNGPGEIYIADFDGKSAQAITSDNAIVAKPAWVPGKLAIYYTSYARDNPDIFSHSLSTGQRSIIASYSGLNTSAAVSPDGSRVAMVLSKSGSPNIWVCNPDGSGLKHLTTGAEDSSPCWSPDGQWICFATKINGRRRLAKVSAGGGAVQPLNTTGAPNPTEPDWSPDGKWIAFTSQAREFDICVMPANGGGSPVLLVPGQNPSWAPNSRTLVFNHRLGNYRQTLSVLDVFTKQYKDCARATGSNSQPAWAR
ncbi:MAG TPA: LpqB family beta-propeller domain-containing protein [Verrucomicrobiae bacterium]